MSSIRRTLGYFDQESKSAARVLLAVPAMADCNKYRLSISAVTHSAAQAAALDIPPLDYLNARLRDCGRCDWGCDETNTGRLQQLTTFHDHLAMQATVPDAVTRKNRFRNARPPWAFPRRL
jgi:hypothetical protein